MMRLKVYCVVDLRVGRGNGKIERCGVERCPRQLIDILALLQRNAAEGNAEHGLLGLLRVG